MADQYCAIVEETTRGTDPGSGYLALPLMGQLMPTITFNDESRQEFRGQDTALGNLEAVRRESQWSMTVEAALYPIAAMGLMFKHAFGKSGSRSVIETTGYTGITYGEAAPYGVGRELVAKAIGFSINYDKEGTTVQRYFGGGRIKSFSVTGEGTDDVKVTFEVIGPGEYIGAEEALLTPPSFTTLPSPFTTDDVELYIGAGITRTGTGPDFTDIAFGTMAKYCPDSFSLTYTNGLDDKFVFCGIAGPSKTSRTGQVTGEFNSPIDFEDPASGFSSSDEWNSMLADVHTNSVLILMDNGELAGDTTENYQYKFDLANLLAKHESPTFSSDGVAPGINLQYETLDDSTANYPVGLFTVDQESAY